MQRRRGSRWDDDAGEPERVAERKLWQAEREAEEDAADRRQAEAEREIQASLRKKAGDWH